MSSEKWWKCSECFLQFRGQKDKIAHVQWHIRLLANECCKLTAKIDEVHAKIHRWRQHLRKAV